MLVEILVQKDKENSIIEKIQEEFSRSPRKAFFCIGTLKDTGFKLIEEEIIDTKTKIIFSLGIDKKNTTRVMLDSLLKECEEVYYYSNNNTTVEYTANTIVFEYAKEAVMYNFSGNLSDSTIEDNVSVYTKILYDLSKDEESKEYKRNIKNLIKVIQEKFEILDKEKIEKLVEEKEIFTTRQYVHNIKSIAELLGNKDKEEIKEDLEQPEIETPKFDFSSIDFDIDIDIPEEEIVIPTKTKEDDVKEVENKKEEIESNIDIELDDDIEEISDEAKEQLENSYKIDKENELYDESLKDFDFDENDTLDINSMLFSKSDISLDMDEIKKEEEENKEEEEILKVKKVNLSSISNYIFELPSRTSKGQEVNSLKIPSYIQNMIPKFFEINEKGKNEKINDIDYKTRNIKLEIVDVKNNQKYTDRNAKLTLKKGQSFMLLTTEKLSKIEYDELDIARIIKLSSDIFHVEIISKDMQEYKIWDKVCKQKFKSSQRHYGMM